MVKGNTRLVPSEATSLLRTTSETATTSSNPELEVPSTTRLCSDQEATPFHTSGSGWGRLPLKTPKCSGKSWTELQVFLTDLRAHFLTQHQIKDAVS